MLEKKKIKYFKVMLVFIIVIVSISCNKKMNKQNINLFKYDLTDSIKVKFNNATKIHSLARIESKFVCIDFLNRSNIILFDNDGVVLSSYNEKGKGPKEILYAQNLTVYGDTIYVLDNDNSKLLIFNLLNNKINYLDEFKIDSNSISLVKINDDRILISHLGAYKNLSLYNKDGKLIDSYSINSKKTINNLEDFLSTAMLISRFPKSNHILIGGATTGDLTFCNFNNDSLAILKETKIKHKVSKKPDVETNDEKKKTDVNLNGIRAIQCVKNYCYVSTKDLSLIHSFEVYDKEGNYKGLSKLVDMKGEIFYFIFSNNSDTLWFMKKGIDNTIYIAKKIK